MKVLQISSEVNSGSVGRIAEQIGEVIINEGWESYIAFGRKGLPSKSQTFTIGDSFDKIKHGIYTRITDRHAFASRKATKVLIEQIKEINPDLIHMQHLHGYYINIEILFKYLEAAKKPIVWTFHDCWSFTGHCAHFEFVGCDKWKTQCYDCEQKHEYPKSLLLDSSRQNYIDKKRIFNSVDNMTIVSVSNWMAGKVKESFLKDYPCKVIQNGIDLGTFYPKGSKALIEEKYNLKDKFILLGVASTWETKKGLEEFYKLAGYIDNDKYAIILVGLSESQVKKLPENIIGIQRTENVGQLADLYSAADVFLNPTFEDSFPTTNLESLACGTPVVTYRTGGSVESISPETGIVVEQGDVTGLMDAIQAIKNKGKKFYEDNCRESAIKNFDKSIKFNDYFKLYTEILKK